MNKTYRIQIWHTADGSERFIPMKRVLWFWWKRFVAKGYYDFHANHTTMDAAERYIRENDNKSNHIAIYFPDDDYTTPLCISRSKF